MPIGQDPRYVGGAIGLLATDIQRERPAPQESPALLDTLASAARVSTLPGAAYERFVNSDPDIDTPANYDPFDDIQGYEREAGLFVDARSKSDVEGIKSRIQSSRRDREVLERSGMSGTASEVGLTFLDPTFLVSMAVPELMAAKGMQARGLVTGAVEGFVAAGAYETGMQALQDDRTAFQSAISLAGGVILGGALGGLLRRVPKAERKASEDAINDTILNPARSEVGAASSSAPTTLAAEEPARGAKQLLKAANYLPGTKTDMQVVFESPSLRAQQTLEELAEVPVLKAKNTEDFGFIPSNVDSVESRAIRTDATLANFRDAITAGYREYRKAGGKLKPAEFEAEISMASRRKDKSAIPQVEPLARKLRAEIFDPSAEEARALGILEDPLKADQQRLTEKAVGNYVKTESKQLYADYSARVLAAAKGGAGQQGDAIGAATTRQQIRTEVERALNVERRAMDDGLSKASGKLDAAEKLYSKTLGQIRRKYAGSPGALEITRQSLRAKRREIRTARTSLEVSRKAERKSRIAERKRYAETSKAVRAQARSQVEKIKPASRKQFLKRARAGGDADPAVAKMTDLIRKQESGLLADVVTVPKSKVDPQKVLGAQSYFRRMYDRDKIRAGRAIWNDKLVKHFRAGGADELEARAAAEDVTRQVMGADVGMANFNLKVSVPEAGPLKGRTLSILDSEIEQFLVNDPVKVAKAYLRDMVPQIEMVKRFGDRDMKGRLEEITQEFDVLREQVRKSIPDVEKQSAALTKLDGQQDVAVKALVRVRDRILGRATKAPTSEGGRRIVEVVRSWRNLVASAKLGTTSLITVPQDLARISAQYGFGPTMGKLAKLASSADFRAISKAKARKAGAAVEVALSRRVQDAFDGAITEGWSNTLAQSVYKYTGLNHWMDFSRTLNATLLEDRVLKVAGQFARGETPKAFDRARLAQLGLGEKQLRQIAAQAEKHGAEIDGLRTSGSANWDDGIAAQAYDDAILKESRQNVLQPGAANRVWWMDSELGKTVGQLKTFSLASANSYSGAVAGAIGQGQYAYAGRFIGYMMIGGYLADTLRRVASEREINDDAASASVAAMNQSGLLGVLPDIISPLGRMLTRAGKNAGILDEDTPLNAAFGDSARFSDRDPISALGGPSLGAAVDLWDIMMNRLDNGISAADIHAIRRMLPFQNVWYLRRIINALEGEVAEAVTGEELEKPVTG